MQNHEILQKLIAFSSDMSAQLQEILAQPELEEETKTFISTNLVLIDAMTKTAMGMQPLLEINQQFVTNYSQLLETNYNFCKKIFLAMD